MCVIAHIAAQPNASTVSVTRATEIGHGIFCRVRPSLLVSSFVCFCPFFSRFRAQAYSAAKTDVPAISKGMVNGPGSMAAAKPTSISVDPTTATIAFLTGLGSVLYHCFHVFK